MALLSAQVPGPAGAAPTYTAVSASDQVPNSGGRTVVIVRNASGASINVTIVGTGKIEDLTVANRVIAVPAGQDRLISLPAALYNDADGRVTLNFSATASVTIAVLNLP